MHEVDLDGGARLPDGEFGLALLLGVLYHLKNPVFVLEQLAQRCHYCLMSTRVWTDTPDEAAPLAYLLDDDELNGDKTNYWLFTEAALRRLLRRSGWSVVTSKLLAQLAVAGSDPWHTDSRIYALLASRVGLRGVRLLDGWYGKESSGWRWTAQGRTA